MEKKVNMVEIKPVVKSQTWYRYVRKMKHSCKRQMQLVEI